MRLGADNTRADATKTSTEHIEHINTSTPAALAWASTSTPARNRNTRDARAAQLGCSAEECIPCRCRPAAPPSDPEAPPRRRCCCRPATPRVLHPSHALRCVALRPNLTLPPMPSARLLPAPLLCAFLSRPGRAAVPAGVARSYGLNAASHKPRVEGANVPACLCSSYSRRDRRAGIPNMLAAPVVVYPPASLPHAVRFFPRLREHTPPGPPVSPLFKPCGKKKQCQIKHSGRGLTEESAECRGARLCVRRHAP